MRNIKDEIDASWFASNPDAEHQIIHRKFRAQASWMMIDLPRLPSIYKELLIEGGLLRTAETIGRASMIAETRQH